MASFVFENGTQAQASSLQAGDTLVFQSATATTLGVSYTPASGLNAATVTLTSGGQSLQFAATALSGATTTFLVGGGTLVFGTDGDNAGLNAGGDNTAADAVYGFSGNDTITVAGGAPHVVYGGAGNDTINASAATGLADGTAPAGSAQPNTGTLLYGGAGNDTITGGNGNDRIYGNEVTAVQGSVDGGDSIDGGAGNDYIQGNAGNDTLIGGLGEDRIFGGADNDSIDGGAGNDTINGNVGNDTILGDAGNDFLRGGQGDDTISGGAGNDQLFGDVGNDTLGGGAGVDVLTGGAGNDVFVFTAGDSVAGSIGTTAFYDSITDFNVTDDTINLAGVTPAVGATAAVVANVIQTPGAAFTTVSAAQTYAQQLLDANTTTGDFDIVATQVGTATYLFSHEAGATIDSIIRLDGVTATTLTNADFI